MNMKDGNNKCTVCTDGESLSISTCGIVSKLLEWGGTQDPRFNFGIHCLIELEASQSLVTALGIRVGDTCGWSRINFRKLSRLALNLSLVPVMSLRNLGKVLKSLGPSNLNDCSFKVLYLVLLPGIYGIAMILPLCELGVTVIPRFGTRLLIAFQQ